MKFETCMLIALPIDFRNYKYNWDSEAECVTVKLAWEVNPEFIEVPSNFNRREISK